MNMLAMPQPPAVGTASAIAHASTDIELESTPITAAWILDGTPVARSALLSRSADGAAATMVWDCTAGRFSWHFELDETVYVIEGSVLVQSDAGDTRRIGPGDTAFFPAGTHAVWHVETYVRKVAFLRQPVPRIIMLAVRAARRPDRVLNRVRMLFKRGGQ